MCLDTVRYPVASHEVKGSNIPREEAPINGPRNGQFIRFKTSVSEGRRVKERNYMRNF